jgi:indole-3-glycerol phosphate synthase
MISAILESKREEIEQMGALRPGPRRRPLMPLVFNGPDGPVNIIAELKSKSPSAGFLGEVEAERVAIYSKYARGISVLTDRTYFGGSFELLEQIAGRTDLPLLCKDFIIDESQIDLAYAKGADLILLIVRILSKERLSALYAHAKALGLSCLIEIHDSWELGRIPAIIPQIIGVNARDLSTLRIDFDTALAVLSRINSPIRIAESGIKSRHDIERFKAANGFLIGEMLMRSRDLEATFAELLYSGTNSDSKIE